MELEIVYTYHGNKKTINYVKFIDDCYQNKIIFNNFENLSINSLINFQNGHSNYIEFSSNNFIELKNNKYTFCYTNYQRRNYQVEYNKYGIRATYNELNFCKKSIDLFCYEMIQLFNPSQLSNISSTSNNTQLSNANPPSYDNINPPSYDDLFI